MSLDRLDRVCGATRIITTGRREQRPEADLIAAYKKNEDGAHHRRRLLRVGRPRSARQLALRQVTLREERRNARIELRDVGLECGR